MASNVDKIIKQLDARKKELEQKAFTGINKAADILRNEMILSIEEISQGRVYGGHTASKPGDAPNTDTGRLVSSIQKKAISPTEMEVGSYNLEYAKYLELGTSRMEARPFVQPAFDKHKENIKKVIEDNLK